MWPGLVSDLQRLPESPQVAGTEPPSFGEYLIVHAGVAYKGRAYEDRDDEDRDDKITVETIEARTIWLRATEAKRLLEAGAVVASADLAAYRERLRIPADELPDGSTESDRQAALECRGLGAKPLLTRGNRRLR